MAYDFDRSAVGNANPRRLAVLLILERTVERCVKRCQVIHADCRPVHTRPELHRKHVECYTVFHDNETHSYHIFIRIKFIRPNCTKLIQSMRELLLVMNNGRASRRYCFLSFANT